MLQQLLGNLYWSKLPERLESVFKDQKQIKLLNSEFKENKKTFSGYAFINLLNKQPEHFIHEGITSYWTQKELLQVAETSMEQIREVLVYKIQSDMQGITIPEDHWIHSELDLERLFDLYLGLNVMSISFDQKVNRMYESYINKKSDWFKSK